MTRNYFSKKGGPYFVGQTFSQHTDSHEDHTHEKPSILDKIKKFLKLFK
jgi:hypothetical protein